MSDLLSDPVFFNLTPDDYRRADLSTPESPISPLSEKSLEFPTFDSLDYQARAAVKAYFEDHEGHHDSPKRRRSALGAKRPLSAYLECRQPSVINGLPVPSAPSYWPSYDALCDGKDPRDPSFIQEQDKFPGSPSSDITFNNSVIRQVLGTRTIYRTGKCEYLVHWAGYPRGQLSWVFQDIIRPIAEHQIMFFEYERCLSCYKGPHGEIFTRKDAFQCSEGDEEDCVSCARCGRGCN
ncbi:uncharacterized protein FFB20_13587 [Fusarium fujikuroi]|uniref:Uncharacterized protein n=1 Tax=Fusarium fujikuroi TaxID=5127 RepID=A0A2H3T1F6_FUSFU|nr:Uncharacterized protein Y057_8439 [Fusarium fujikuroi]KLP18065.1 Uncharacterized protein LW94_14726 [Fusarium fujikuroi]QGI88732.1 hypothetical protein CEK25_003688 [Fusarium fujikuroi]SCO10618.1 uncharacterized protein FFB20_13587 [Fusarium fujikuroi]SCO23869.1 uncharacterized protein FFE2_15787 [Fusarium fujikuroi]